MYGYYGAAPISPPVPGTAAYQAMKAGERAARRAVRRAERRLRLWEIGGGTIGAILGSRYALRMGESRLVGSVAGGAAGGLLGSLVDRLLAR